MGETDRNPSFTGIPPHVRIVSVIEGIQHGKYALKDGLVSKMIEGLDRRGSLGGFDHYQIRVLFLFLFFSDKIIDGIGKERGGRLRRESLILGLILGGPRCMHGTAQSTCCQRYGSFCP